MFAVANEGWRPSSPYFFVLRISLSFRGATTCLLSRSSFTTRERCRRSTLADSTPAEARFYEIVSSALSYKQMRGPTINPGQVSGRLRTCRRLAWLAPNATPDGHHAGGSCAPEPSRMLKLLKKERRDRFLLMLVGTLPTRGARWRGQTDPTSQTPLPNLWCFKYIIPWIYLSIGVK